jgi:hypothetical protein
MFRCNEAENGSEEKSGNPFEGPRETNREGVDDTRV